MRVHPYLPPTLQEVADIVVPFGHQMERFPDDLLLHVLRLQHTRDAVQTQQSWKPEDTQGYTGVGRH